jgi:hypothetical protein
LHEQNALQTLAWRLFGETATTCRGLKWNSSSGTSSGRGLNNSIGATAAAQKLQKPQSTKLSATRAV